MDHCLGSEWTVSSQTWPSLDLNKMTVNLNGIQFGIEMSWRWMRVKCFVWRSCSWMCIMIEVVLMGGHCDCRSARPTVVLLNQKKSQDGVSKVNWRTISRLYSGGCSYCDHRWLGWCCRIWGYSCCCFRLCVTVAVAISYIHKCNPSSFDFARTAFFSWLSLCLFVLGKMCLFHPSRSISNEYSRIQAL